MYNQNTKQEMLRNTYTIPPPPPPPTQQHQKKKINNKQKTPIKLQIY